MSNPVSNFIKQLDGCPKGKSGWRQYEKLCTEILKFLFSPSINITKKTRTLSGVNRRDAIFSNRNVTLSSTPDTRNWHHLYHELNARLIVFEFKNYGTEEIGHEEVMQASSYLSLPMGKLAILVCNKKPNLSAHTKRNTIYSNEKKVILFLTNDDLKEMMDIKSRNEDPSDLVMDLIDQFYIQHE